MNQYIQNISSEIITNLGSWLEYYTPKVLWAIALLGIGTLFAILAYRTVMYVFKRFKILEHIDSFLVTSKQVKKSWDNTLKKSELTQKLTSKIELDIVISKACAYYIFLLFFRFAIVVIGIVDVEQFLAELLTYLPSLFIAFIIWFFGLRFANFIYDVTYHAVQLSDKKTAKIIAYGSKIIILFFTLMAVLWKVGIAHAIIDTILIGFISMLAIAWGLAFGLGWKDIARDILESFRK